MRLYFFVACLRSLLLARLQSRDPLPHWEGRRGNAFAARIVVPERFVVPCPNHWRREGVAQAYDETARAAAKQE